MWAGDSETHLMLMVIIVCMVHEVFGGSRGICVSAGNNHTWAYKKHKDQLDVPDSNSERPS